MFWYVLAQLWSTFFVLMRIVRLSTEDKDLEILILRQQLNVLQRRQQQAIRPCREERWTLAMMVAALKKRDRLTTRQLESVIRIFKPETVIG